MKDTIIQIHNYEEFSKNNKNLINQWINIYISVLNNSLEKFPYGFWTQQKEFKALCLVNYLLNDILMWDKKTILQQYNSRILKEYKLGTVHHIFEDNYTLIKSLYPDDNIDYKDVKFSNYETKWTELDIIKQKELRKNKENFDYLKIYKDVLNNKLNKLPRNFWNEESRKLCLKYVFDDILNWSKEDIYNNVTSKLLKNDFKFKGILNSNFDLLKVIQILYPETKEEDIKSLKLRVILSENHKNNLTKINSNTSPVEIYKMVLNKELDKFPRNFWTKEISKECLNYLINDKLKWSKKEFIDNISSEVLDTYKLKGPFKYIWNSNMLTVIHTLYDDVNMFEVKNLKRNWKDLNTQIEFTKWLLEEKLKWSKEDIKEKFSRDLFKKEYSGFLKHAINGDLVSLIENVYPNEIYAYEVKNLSLKRDYWDSRKELMKNVIIEKIKEANINISEIPKVLTHRKVRAIKIPNSIFIYFNKNVFDMIDFAYPNTFEKEQFNK